MTINNNETIPFHYGSIYMWLDRKFPKVWSKEFSLATKFIHHEPKIVANSRVFHRLIRWIAQSRRMHSSRMRTGRSLTVWRGEGGSPCLGVLLAGGSPCRGVSLFGGVLLAGGSPCRGAPWWGGGSPCQGGLPARGSPYWGGSPCWGVSLAGGVLPAGGSPCKGGLLGGGGALPAGDPPC